MWSDAIVVHPWVGKNYQNPTNLRHRTLVLGESSFTKSEKFESDLAINCVLNDLSIDPTEERDTTGFCRFSTKIRRIVFGRDEAIGSYNFWQDVAFYNFVQSIVGDKARIRPTQAMWESSVPAFIEVVSLLQPSRVFVLGKANWENLLAHIEHEIVDPFTVRLKVDSNFVVAGYIHHPSSSLSYNKWQPIAQKFLLG
jgi:hypothetical protein